MKKVLFLCFLSSCATWGFAQDAKVLLQKGFDNCLRINSGTFTAKSEFVSMMDEPGDTSVTWGVQTFRKIPANPIMGAVYTVQEFKDEAMTTLSSGRLFNGSEFIKYHGQDTLGTVFDTVNWKYAVEQQVPNVLFEYYSARSIKVQEKGEGDELSFSLLGMVKYQEKTCWKIKIELRTVDSMNIGVYKGYDQIIYLTQADTLPVYKATRLIIQMGSKDYFQYNRTSILSYTFNQLDNEWMPHAPEGMVVKPYVEQPEVELEQLEVGHPIPDLSMAMLATGDSMRLADLKGKVVVLDFFYRSCPPCLMAMPKLQAIQEKFGPDKVVVLGVNSIDKGEILKPFLEDQGITYSVGLIDRDAPKKFFVRGYPTLFIIDKNGNLLSQEIGYGEGMELKWETEISNALNN